MIILIDLMILSKYIYIYCFLKTIFDFVNKSSSKVFNELASSGILLRKMDIYGIKNSLRVTIGNKKENEKFISKLKKIFNV